MRPPERAADGDSYLWVLSGGFLTPIFGPPSRGREAPGSSAHAYKSGPATSGHNSSAVTSTGNGSIALMAQDAA